MLEWFWWLSFAAVLLFLFSPRFVKGTLELSVAHMMLNSLLETIQERLAQKKEVPPPQEEKKV